MRSNVMYGTACAAGVMGREGANRPAFEARSRSAMTIVEGVVALGVLALVVASTFLVLGTVNRIAAETRYRIVAKAIVQDYIDTALNEAWTANSVPGILATNAAGSDLNGDGAGDGSLYLSNVPIYVQRDTATNNTNTALVTGNLYRQVTVVDTTNNIRRVAFLLRYVARGKTNYWGEATLRAIDD